MTVVVPFDGTPLSKAALRRADELGNLLDEQVVATSVIPTSNVRYARERGWLGDDEEFDPEQVVSWLSHQVDSIAPKASFEYEVVGRYAQPGEIASKIRRRARKTEASLVVVGSDNAGRIVSTVSSIGSSVAADPTYDVLIIRHSDGEMSGEIPDGPNT